MQYLAIIKAILALLPVIIEAVRAIEAAFPVSGQGANKLAAIREMIEGAYDVAEDATIKFEKLWPAIQRTIAAVVGLANSSGIFKK